MNPWHVIEQLYLSEINAGLETDWNRGVRVWIAAGGRRLAEHTFLQHEFDAVGAWLDGEARLLFPRSQYATNVPDRDQSSVHGESGSSSSSIG